MMTMVTRGFIARSRGTTRQAVAMAIKRGKLIISEDGQCDMSNPVNIEYMSGPKGTGKHASYADNIKRAVSKVQKSRPSGSRARPDPPQPSPQQLQMNDIAEQAAVATAQKLYEDTRLKRVSADLKSLEFAKRIEVLVDLESLNRKFGLFVDYLTNGLLTIPESVSPILVSIASTSDNPEIDVQNELKRRIASSVKLAKQAATEIQAPTHGARYTFESFDGREDDDRI